MCKIDFYTMCKIDFCIMCKIDFYIVQIKMSVLPTMVQDHVLKSVPTMMEGLYVAVVMEASCPQIAYLVKVIT